MSIQHKIQKKKDHVAWLSVVFPFDVEFIILIEDTEE